MENEFKIATRAGVATVYDGVPRGLDAEFHPAGTVVRLPLAWRGVTLEAYGARGWAYVDVYVDGSCVDTFPTPDAPAGEFAHTVLDALTADVDRWAEAHAAATYRPPAR